jgi:hypothetical protein
VQHIQWIFSGIGVAVLSALTFWWRSHHQARHQKSSSPLPVSNELQAEGAEARSVEDKRRTKERQRVEAQRVFETQRVAIGDFFSFEMDIWHLKVEIVDIRDVEVKELYHTRTEMMVHVKVGSRLMFPGRQVQQVGENEFLIPKLQGIEEAQCIYGFSNDRSFFVFMRVCVLHINAHARTADVNFVGLLSWL